MTVVDLINYLRLEGPHDQECIPTTSEEDAPPPEDELTDEEGNSKDKGDVPTAVGLAKEDDPSEEEPMKGEDPEKDPSEVESMEEEDPKKDLSVEELMEEEDPAEDSEVSEGKLMGSEDLKGGYREIEPRGGLGGGKEGVHYAG